MADLNIALILRLVDRATAPARAAMRNLERLGGDSLARQAERVSRGTRLMTAGLNDVGNAALRGGTVVAAYGAGMTALAASFVRPAAQFEQFNVQLTTLEGSSAKAEQAMAWIEGFATRTPLSVEETVQAYARLKAFGLDPTTGSLQAMVDTMAATGGGAEKLDGLTLALGQAWTKGKLQGEEAMQMLERGVPVWDLLAEAMGKSAAEVQKLSEQGKLGREEITLLTDALGARYSGASKKASETWDGITSNLSDQWTRFQRMVMDAGLFDWMKDKLEGLLDKLDEMAKDGTLQIWATSLATNITLALSGIFFAISGIYFFIKDQLYPALESVATAVGGWDVLGWIALALMFSGTLLKVAAGVRLIAAGLLLLSANPVVALALAFTALAAVIYFNWDSIVTYFSDKIEAIRKAFDEGLLNGVLAVIAEFNPLTLIGEALMGVNALILSAFDIDLYAIGAQWITDLRAGIAAQIDALTGWVRDKFDAMIPDWMQSATAGGAALIGDGYAGMGGAMDTGFEGRALGGPVRAGRMYRWQEEGQEVFVPRTDGTVISTRQLRGLRGGGRAAPAFHIGAIHVTAAPGQSARDVALAVRRELEDMARAAPLHDGGFHD
ncbi:MAG: tape measure protein [Rhodobacter sp.]|nr:tape measure protein [Rhodobacter sp.]MCA3459397.1 tape measure protein [Rhodobacter sp.]MCA3461724.1 tape measure protein [Rhodobacter sp.]MCA3464522.1 tape measure protein [Rhodobacter sp.]MCA3467502.1 tape measure protein [Rhodobacter sp.]